MKTLNYIINYSIILFFSSFALAQENTVIADILITNAKVTTLNPENPITQAIAIKGNKIIAVGSGWKHCL